MFKRLKQIIGAKELIEEQVGNYFYYGSCRWEEDNKLKILDSKRIETVFSINTYATNSMKLIIESVRGKKEYHLEKLPEANDSIHILNVVDFDSNHNKLKVFINEDLAIFRIPDENTGFYFSRDALPNTEPSVLETKSRKKSPNKPLESFQLNYHTIQINSFIDLSYISTLELPPNINMIAFNKCFINQELVDIMNLKLFDISAIEFNDCELEDRNWSNQEGAVYDMTSRKKFKYVKSITAKNINELKQLFKVVDSISFIRLIEYKIDKELVDLINENYFDRNTLGIELENCDLSNLGLLLELKKEVGFSFKGNISKLNDELIKFIKNTKAKKLSIYYKHGTEQEDIAVDILKLKKIQHLKIDGFKSLLMITKLNDDSLPSEQ